MGIVTITSDWKASDYYLAALKGALASCCIDVRIMDLAHGLKPYDLAQAAFVVRNAYLHYPAGSVHLLALNSDSEKGKGILAASKNGHYFLCTDNGILGLLGGPDPPEVVRMAVSENSSAGLSAELRCMVAAAGKLLKGSALADIGEKADDHLMTNPVRASIEENRITGNIIYIDGYQNAISNISRKIFEQVGRGRSYTILVQSKYYSLTSILDAYNETDPGEMLAMFNSAGLLEIAIRNGRAAELLNLNTNSTIRVEFNQE